MAASLFDVDGALMTLLQADPTLHAIATDGIWFGSTPSQAHRYVLVNRITGDPTYEFQDVAWLDLIYQVKAVLQGTSSVDLKTAADRIDALLLHGTVTPPAYLLRDQLLEAPIRYVEVDPINADLRWQHGGGRYLWRVIPTA